MTTPYSLPLFEALKIQLKSDFERAVEQLRPAAPSRDLIAFRVFNLIMETEAFYAQYNITPKTLHENIEKDLIQQGWTTARDGRLPHSTRDALQLLPSYATDERNFRVQMNLMRQEQPELATYVMNHLRDISKARANVSVQLVNELAIKQNLRLMMPPRI